MTGRDDVRNAVNHAENEYRRSWATIEALKRGDSSLDADDLMGYQTTLAGALFGLDELYRTLCQEERQLISRKSEQNEDWTKARLRIVHDHQDTLRHAIAIGKVLGDCFAWMFYSQDREMLDHHMAHERQFHTPPGLGGLTERSFIDRVRVIGRYIVLYHGITDMLRVGDISLYDPETRRVAALGELKANSREGDVISLELSLIASKGTPETIFQVPVVVSSETIERPQRPPQMEARLKRQMHEMASALHASDPDASLSLVTSKRVGDLESLHAALGTRRWACKKIGDGYLLIAIRPKGKSLATRLTNGSVPDVMIQLELENRLGEVSILFTGGLHGRDTQTVHRGAEDRHIATAPAGAHRRFGSVRRV